MSCRVVMALRQRGFSLLNDVLETQPGVHAGQRSIKREAVLEIFLRWDSELLTERYYLAW